MKFFKRLFSNKQVTPVVQQPPQTKSLPKSVTDEDTITIITTTTIQLPKLTSVDLPKSEYFKAEDVKEFEKELLKCSNCTDNCKGRKLARYIVKTGLDEFVRQKKENCLPEDIADALESMGIASLFSYDGGVAIYDKLQRV